MPTEPERAPIRLRDLQRCFLGVVPATIATCSPEGIPNITFLSTVHFLDDTHLALSFQFFNKTHENICANPRAQILLPDSSTLQQYRIDVAYERTEREGDLFERMRANLDAIASQMGMQGIFKLAGADVYRVLGVEALAHDLDLRPPDGPADFVAALERLSAQLASIDDLGELLDAALAGLDEHFGYRHSMILLADDDAARLFGVASHGLPESGVGCEVPFGEGLVGMSASERRSLRISHLRLEQSLGSAIRTTAHARGHVMDREIPVPGHPDAQCHVVVPLLARDRVLGVLSVQSAEPGRLTEVDERVLTTLARYLSSAMQLVSRADAGEAPRARPRSEHPSGARVMKIRHHAADDSIFVDGEYLIKGVAGRLLLRLLADHERDGRVDFSNKELRVDRTLGLGRHRDNLDARLILLRKRLEERCEALRLVKTTRGHFRLEVGCRFTLERSA